MQPINDSLRAAVKIEGLPERAEFGSWNEVLQALQKYLVVELPQYISGIIYSASEPAKDARDNLWFRMDGSGGISGIYYYAKGAWELVYQYPLGAIQWIYGDSANPPKGFVAIDDGDAVLDPSTVTQLKNRYIISPGATSYIYYAARFDGY